MLDAPDHSGRSQHAQIWSILADIPVDSQLLLEAALNRPSLAPSSLYHDHWLFAAARQAGQAEAAWPRLERCFRLLDAGFTTMPEEDGEFGWIRSECHAWSSWPAQILLEEVLGLRLTGPASMEIHAGVRPGLTWAEGTRPWRNDLVTCRWEASGEKLRLSGRIPAGLSATLVLADGTRRALPEGLFAL